MVFAWRPNEPRPLCVPTRRGELWDPRGCSFRPSLVAFSPDRWIPTQLSDPLGLHLVIASGDPEYVHLMHRRLPTRALRERRDALPFEVRDGDIAWASAIRPSCLIPLLLATSCLYTPRSGSLLCAALGISICRGSHLATSLPSFAAFTRRHQGWTTAQTLFSTYASAWGAPVPVLEPPHISLCHTAGAYAILSAHFLRKPLRRDLPAFAPGRLQRAWLSFPVWGTGVPDEVFLATDGSGDGNGSWAFVAWALWRGQWYRIGWDCGPLCHTPWLPPAPVHGADTRSYLGELGALTSAAAWLTAW